MLTTPPALELHRSVVRPAISAMLRSEVGPNIGARLKNHRVRRCTDDPRIFLVSPSAATQAWWRARKHAGVQDLRLHDLRHEATSSLFELGLNVMEVAAVTGHKDLRSLKRYTHIDPVHLARKIADLKSQQQQPAPPTPRRGQKKKFG